MAVFMFAILYAVTFLRLTSAYISSDDAAVPILPTEYHFKGEIDDVFNGISEPFEIWYSENRERSRMNVYNGTVKKYYWSDDEKVVTMYPVATDSKNVKIVCDYVEEEKLKKPYNILPKGLKWRLTGGGLFNGESTQIWQAENPKKRTTFHHTLVTRNVGNIDAPVSLETIKFKVSTGMTVGHLNTIFYAYNATVEKEDVDIDQDKFDSECDYNPYGSIEEGMQHLRPYISADVHVAYKRYKTHHKKSYNNNEHEKRQEIFEMNWRRVAAHNRKNLGYKLEVNQFADWTEEELLSLTGALPSKESDPGTHPFPHTLEEINNLVKELPEEFDLRIEGILPAIKNQLSCGSCWAFATTATVEAAIIRQHGGAELDLSEQSLVDCGWPYGVMGCNGGFLDAAFKYVKENGIPNEAEYGGYMHEDGYCHIKNMSVLYNIKGYTQVTPHSVNALKYAVYTYGPVEVTIHASDNLILYSSGVIYDMECEGEHLNHAVVVVGYGSRDGEPYWIVRNSWGEAWGEDGYVLMSAKDNNCLILDSPYYPVV